MLPDFPLAKKSLRQIFSDFLKVKIKQYSTLPFADDQVKIIHEGNSLVINYSDGRSYESELKRLGGEESMLIDDLIEQPNSFFLLLDKLAKQIAIEQEKAVFETISDITEKFGQTTKRKNGDPTGEDLLEMFEKLKIDFNSDSSPKMPTIYSAPEMVEKLVAAGFQIEQSEELKRRYQQIIDFKKQEWLDRENNRKLVD